MTKNFEAKIIRERIVDTKNYRYICEDRAEGRQIVRIPMADLDTTATYNREVVKEY